MTDPHDVLRNLALVLCVAAVTTVLSRRLHLPGVFGYLLAGMIVGPHTAIPLLAEARTVEALAEVGVVLLMYALGLEFRLGHLIRLGASAGVAAASETGLMFGLGYATGRILGWSPAECLFTGGIVAISSTTIIARTFADQGVRGPLRETVFGLLIVEDVIAILLIASLSTVAGGSTGNGSILLTGVRLVTFLITLIAVGRWVLPRLFRMILRLGSTETTVVAAVGVSFAAALLALNAGYSVALGAFISGSLVAEGGEGEAIRDRIEPIRDLFVALFFVSVGMLIDPAAVVTEWRAIVALTVVVVAGKTVAVSFASFLSGRPLRRAIETGVSMAQIGEFSVIIAGVGVAGGARASFYPVAVTVSAITTLLTPLLIRRAASIAGWVDGRLPRRLQMLVTLYGSWFDALARGVATDRASVRRATLLLLADVALLAGLAVAAAAEMGRSALWLQRSLGWSTTASYAAVVVAALAAAVPLVAGLVRMTHFLATRLARRSLPLPTRGLDRAEAPRAAFAAVLQYAMLLASVIPVVLVLQPVVPGKPLTLVVMGLTVGGAIATWRSATTLYGHARAGAEVIVMTLLQHDRVRGTDAELGDTMDTVAKLLPGLGNPGPVRLEEGDYAVGRSLAELRLRGSTGATILAITRGDTEHGSQVEPSGAVRLRAGDIVALAGAADAVLTATEILRTGAPPAEPATPV
ncbi:MAG: cation:proton antiporter [Gemmatimonadetes bacterium]|nr:cation:proton antiporter [Gemmatimonadota bacterium]